jgi:uncharacterized protein
VKSKQIQATEPRSWVLVLDKGDDPVPELERFAESNGLRGAHFTGIGAFSDAVVAFFEWESRTYRDIPVREQVEVLSLAGDITESDRGWTVHAHAVLGRADGMAVGGHLRAAHVRPTLEVVLEETPAHLVRVHDAESGLALIDPRRNAPE